MVCLIVMSRLGADARCYFSAQIPREFRTLCLRASTYLLLDPHMRTGPDNQYPRRERTAASPNVPFLLRLIRLLLVELLKWTRAAPWSRGPQQSKACSRRPGRTPAYEATAALPSVGKTETPCRSAKHRERSLHTASLCTYDLAFMRRYPS